MSTERTIRISAPAKINLGLEILSRQDDGYHELRSVLSMIDITDELQITVDAGMESSRIDGVPGITPSDNLIMKAIDIFNGRMDRESVVHVRVMKRIPSPAGLGSASSNAAATLVALNELHGQPFSRSALRELATNLGSDVPFFLGSPTALVSGTGTTLSPLPDPEGWVLIVVPQIDLIAKTTKLYSMLTPEDFSGGENVRQIADHLKEHSPIPPESLTNAFERPLLKLMPYVRKILRVMDEAGCKHIALSGAGPAHYTIIEDETRALDVKQRLKPLLGSHDYVIVTPFRHAPLTTDAG